MEFIEAVDLSTLPSNSNDDILLIFLAYLLRRRKRKTRRFRVHPLWRSRNEKGIHNSLVLEMALVNEALFKNYTRMTVQQYENLLQDVGPELCSYPTRPDIINPSTKLMITLRFLATGESIASLYVQYRMGKATVQKCIYKTLQIIYKKLQPKVLTVPRNYYEWRQIINSFEDQWQFPHCWGALDGKHIVMQAQPHSGSINFNYKKQHSLNLMAICDAEYSFIMIDVGGRGRESDGGVLKRSNFGKKNFNRQLNLPPASEITPGGPKVPFFCVSDKAFPLHQQIMRPFPGRSTGRMPNHQRIFNYRLRGEPPLLRQKSRLSENNFN